MAPLRGNHSGAIPPTDLRQDHRLGRRRYEAGKLASKRVRVYEHGKLTSDKTIEASGD